MAESVPFDMAAPTPKDLYSLPDLYDILHTPETASEVDGLERLFALHGPRPRGKPRWLEPACGTARYLRVAAGRGIRVTGVDVSAEMIDYARDVFAKRKLQGDLILGDITALDDLVESEHFDFAFCPINSIRHIETDAGLVRHLKGIANALKPGGVYAVGMNFGGFDDDANALETPSEDIWEATRGSTHLHQLISYDPPTDPADRFEQVRSVLTVTRGMREPEQHISHYRLRTYNENQWYKLVAKSPLEPAGVVDEQGDALKCPGIGYAIRLLRRPTES
ncbi:MAG: class I SAM-dependent methyltransferase [Planctomycetota bacterium]